MGIFVFKSKTSGDKQLVVLLKGRPPAVFQLHERQAAVRWMNEHFPLTIEVRGGPNQEKPDFYPCIASLRVGQRVAFQDQWRRHHRYDTAGGR